MVADHILDDALEELTGIFDPGGDNRRCINCSGKLGDDWARVQIAAAPMLGQPNLCGSCIEAPGFEFSGVEILERHKPDPPTGRTPVATPKGKLP